MGKESYYFPHDYNARNDKKLVKLKIEHGMQGIGIYWCLIEILYEESGKLNTNDLVFLAKDLKVQKKILESVVCDFDLFKMDDNCFWSESVNNRLSKRMDKSLKASESASHRWRIANAERTHTDRNARKEKKGEEKKEEERSASTTDLLFEMFRRSASKGITDMQLHEEVGKFKNKYPHLHVNQAGAVINAWVSRIGEEKPLEVSKSTWQKRPQDDF